MKENGLLKLNAKELEAFVKAPYPSSWFINTANGETRIESGAYNGTAPPGCAFLMDGPNPIWVFQWAGNWQRACDEQLNPLLASAFPGGS